MQSAEFEREDALRTRRQQESQESPRADRPANEGPNLLSALGNAQVQRLLHSQAVQRQEDGSGAVDDEVANSIQGQRGGGQALDESARSVLEPAFGQDFSDVRVHTDSSADSLNRAVSAEAFTTGRDIFFRSGSYKPDSADGRKLLAHELTHVVQQDGAPPSGEMTVSSPEDASEQQASAVADSVGPAIGREAMPEEEELQMSAVERQELPEEEELQMSAIERQELPEEEELQMSAIERQEIPEEEELQMSAIERQEIPEELADRGA